jgi:hypothetical protein
VELNWTNRQDREPVIRGQGQGAPPAVQAMARVLSCNWSVPPGLLSDARMKSVWRELRRAKARRDRLDQLPSWQRLQTWEINLDVSVEDEAHAAFIAFVIVEFGSSRTVCTRAEAEELSTRYIVPLCAAAREAAASENEILLDRAKFYEWQRDHLLRSPYCIGDRRCRRRLCNWEFGDNLARGRVRALAAWTRRVWGQPLYGTIAKVASVALETKIARKSVINWCHDLSVSQ